MRIKSGLYGGDLAFVEDIENEKIWVRLVPRLNNPGEKVQRAKKGESRYNYIRPR